MPGHDIVVVGASAGGVEALSALVGALPADLDAAVLMVLHIPPNSPSALPAILNRRGPLPVRHAGHGDPIEPGRILVAPPDHHLLVKDGRNDGGRVHLTRGPRENGHRPAVDVLFRSAATAFGPRVVGVVLSGSLDDGVAGAAAIKRQGGIVLVQDPAEALATGMPERAIEHVAVDEVGPIPALAATIERLSKEPAANPAPEVPRELAVEAAMGELEMHALHQEDRPGRPSGFACPDCGGVLWELRGGNPTRFRCRVGHAWSAEALLDQQLESLEASLWIALRSLEERAALARRLRDSARLRGHVMSGERFETQASQAQRAAERIREFLLSKSGQSHAEGI